VAHPRAVLELAGPPPTRAHGARRRTWRQRPLDDQPRYTWFVAPLTVRAKTTQSARRRSNHRGTCIFVRRHTRPV
jgi:hypothetical protein